MKIAVMGFGTVGSGVVEVLDKNRQSVLDRAGEEIEVKYILDIRDFPDSPYGDRIIHDFEAIVNDPEIDAVCETIGGAKLAYDFTKRLLEAGKSVITSNKELVATKGPELLELAKSKNVNYFFEASVGGGIPIIRALYESLSGNEVTKIAGILNGTTNYILTKMINEGQSFEAALKQAQKLGYAEQNPDADVLGIDSCRKIAILSSIAFGNYVDPALISVKGITEITAEDVEAAARTNRVIKLLGYAEMCNGRLSVRVEPFVISRENPLSNVEGVNNAITVTGNALGDVMFYGPGAGKLPTASAVVADVIDSCKHKVKGKDIRWKGEDESFVIPSEETKTAYMMRFKCLGESLLNMLRAAYGSVELVSQTDSETVVITPVRKIKEHMEIMNSFGNEAAPVSWISVF